jgi:hypothetical protein
MGGARSAFCHTTWLAPAAQQILARAVAQAAVCELQEAQPRALRAQAPPDADATAPWRSNHAG